ncbi:MAG: ribosome small subunit-dependent GTPase A [Abditibacteriota bacterium]|nr:ribosome small subunit-dependent GTPase A [Abditibacteriota bacterium]
MNIKDYGFTEDIIDDRTAARIVAVHKDRYRTVSDRGEGFARLKRGCYYSSGEYPATGDFVLMEYNETGDSLICETLPRKSVFVRAAVSDAGRSGSQTVAANFDYVLIAASLNRDFNPARLERYLSMAWESGGIPVVVLTKSDLVPDPQPYVEQVRQIAPGTEVFALSSVTGEGTDGIGKYFAKGKTIVLLGSSGVGKSTLVNTLCGREVMKTSAIREDDSRGRHTTVTRSLIMLPGGAMVIDTPGMRELGMFDAEEGIGKTFADAEALAGQCRFPDCTHTVEPGCALLAAIEEGTLTRERYERYMKLGKESRYNSDPGEFLKEKRNKFRQIAKENKRR